MFPARSAEEYLSPGGIRSVTISATMPRAACRTITSRQKIALLARLLDRLHAMPPGADPEGCPAGEYQLSFLPVSADQPTVVVGPLSNCTIDVVTVGGLRQPALEDQDLAVLKIAAQLLPGPPPRIRDSSGSCAGYSSARGGISVSPPACVQRQRGARYGAIRVPRGPGQHRCGSPRPASRTAWPMWVAALRHQARCQA